MLSLYDTTSPSAAIVKLLTGNRPREGRPGIRSRTTETQVLFLIEPSEEEDRAVGETGRTQRGRRAA